MCTKGATIRHRLSKERGAKDRVVQGGQVGGLVITVTLSYQLLINRTDKQVTSPNSDISALKFDAAN